MSNEPQSQCSMESFSIWARKVGSLATEPRNAEKRPVKQSSLPDSAIEHIVRCRKPKRSEIHSANQRGPLTQPFSFVVMDETSGCSQNSGKIFPIKPGCIIVSPSMNTTTPSGCGWSARILRNAVAMAGRLPVSSRKSTTHGGQLGWSVGVNDAQLSAKTSQMVSSSLSQPVATTTFGGACSPSNEASSRKSDRKTARVIHGFS